MCATLRGRRYFEARGVRLSAGPASETPAGAPRGKPLATPSIAARAAPGAVLDRSSSPWAPRRCFHGTLGTLRAPIRVGWAHASLISRCRAAVACAARLLFRLNLAAGRLARSGGRELRAKLLERGVGM
ncbi:hypothetical protein T492DRAFT_1032029 [Pavlovales sp. CCMP2436]|nr:hypothetical protein T492DRAFT_1032029 [Pavlovales sp. CCMP2436]